MFEVSPAAHEKWTQKVIYAFANTPDGCYPRSSLTFDATGNLYGTTWQGGAGVDDASGTVFELTPAPVVGCPNGSNSGIGLCETVLYSFDGYTNDGVYPWGGLLLDSSGNLYGVTSQGGASGYGTVFELTP